ncbi:MAG TPA: glycoside hydrolase family 43 protein [Mobilitalea sp.]|nr:glycoside hydrolase family 43 protein [Mobilitalea sp.]
MMKRLIALMFTVILAASLVLSGCSKKNSQDQGSTEDTKVTTTPTAVPTAGPTPTPEVFTEEPAKTVDTNFFRVSVHDPSIVKADGTYYLFGSHRAWAESTDLMEWETFNTNVSTDYNDLLGGIWADWCKTESNPDLRGNMWAPDVIYNKDMGKYCMYMSVNGNDWNSVIVLLTADDIKGPYEYVGPVIYSGFNTGTHPAEKTDVYKVLGDGADLSRYQSTKNTKLNAIDPCVKYDEDGNLWMSLGSWFGGIYMLRLDNKTGLRDYTTTYETVENVSDQYYGYKLAGGWGVSGEASYVEKFGDYYYLFLSYGGLTAQGGYQIRVFRSDKINGPYVDEAGNSAVYSKAVSNNLSTNIGVRLFASYKFSGNTYTHVAQGHNSVLLDDDGKMFVVFHTRFAAGEKSNAEYHEVHVHQLFLNEDGWLVAAPYEYTGETVPATGYTKQEMVGEYEFAVNKPDTYYQVILNKTFGVDEIKNIALYSDGSVKGDLTGTWSYTEGTDYMQITLDGVTYKGVFVKQGNEAADHKLVMTFTALGNNVTVMASKK